MGVIYKGSNIFIHIFFKQGFKYLPGGVIAGGFATYIYISATSFVTDFGLGVTAIFDICLNLVFSVGLLYVFTVMTCPRPVGFLSRPGK